MKIKIGMRNEQIFSLQTGLADAFKNMKLFILLNLIHNLHNYVTEQIVVEVYPTRFNNGRKIFNVDFR